MTPTLDGPPILRNEVWRGLVWIDKDEDDSSLYRIELVGAVVRPGPPDFADINTVVARGVARNRVSQNMPLNQWEKALLTGDYTSLRMPPEAHLWLPPCGGRTDSTWGLVRAELAALVFAAWAEHMVAVADAEQALRAAEDAERFERARTPGVITRACIAASVRCSDAGAVLLRLRATVRP